MASKGQAGKSAFNWDVYKDRCQALQHLRTNQTHIDMILETEDGKHYELVHSQVMSAFGDRFNEYIKSNGDFVSAYKSLQVHHVGPFQHQRLERDVIAEAAADASTLNAQHTQPTSDGNLVSKSSTTGWAKRPGRVKLVRLAKVNEYTLNTLVQCAYTGYIRTDLRSIWQVLRVADHYAMTEVIRACCGFFERNLNQSNCVYLYHLGMRYKHSLQRSAWSVIRANFKHILAQNITRAHSLATSSLAPPTLLHTNNIMCDDDADDADNNNDNNVLPSDLAATHYNVDNNPITSASHNDDNHNSMHDHDDDYMNNAEEFYPCLSTLPPSDVSEQQQQQHHQSNQQRYSIEMTRELRDELERRRNNLATIKYEHFEPLLMHDRLNIDGEESVWQAIKWWCNYDLDERAARVTTLLPCMRVPRFRSGTAFLQSHICRDALIINNRHAQQQLAVLDRNHRGYLNEGHVTVNAASVIAAQQRYMSASTATAPQPLARAATPSTSGRSSPSSMSSFSAALGMAGGFASRLVGSTSSSSSSSSSAPPAHATRATSAAAHRQHLLQQHFWTPPSSMPASPRVHTSIAQQPLSLQQQQQQQQQQQMLQRQQQQQQQQQPDMLQIPIQRDGHELPCAPHPRQLRPRVPRSILLAIGGWQQGSPTRLIESYDSSCNLWFECKHQIMAQLAYHGIECVQGQLYICGGTDGSDIMREVFTYDPVRGECRPQPSMRQKRCYVSTACLHNFELYVMGGHNGSHRMKSVERFRVGDVAWQHVADMNVARSDASACVHNSLIYIAGGLNDQMIESSVEFYNSHDNTWTFIASMLTPRTSFTLLVCQNQLLAIGGNNGSERLASVEKYSFATRLWSPHSTMRNRRSTFSAAVMDECKVIVVGGYNGQTPFSQVEMFDARTQLWSPLHKIRFDRSGLKVVVLQDLINTIEYTYLGSPLASISGVVSSSFLSGASSASSSTAAATTTTTTATATPADEDAQRDL